ncbi:GGDEF domain-containing protein [Persephonella sp.]
MENKKNLKQIIYSYIYSPVSETDIDKIRLINSFTIVGAAALYIFAFLHYTIGDYEIAFFEFFIATGGVINTILLKLSDGRTIRLSEDFILIGMMILLIGIVIHGGIANTAIFWIFTYPLISFFLKGKKVGLVWNILLIFVIISLSILDKFGIVPIPYEPIEIRQAISAYIVVMVLAYIFETALLSSYEKIKKLATTDPLTGAFNRYKLFKKLEEEIERANRYGNPLSILMFDIDNFKSINDTYGHNVGDLVLKVTINEIKRHLRKTDIIGRFGGEEFLIILPETDLKGAEKIAEKLRDIISDMKTEGIPEITVSIGVAEYKSGEESSDFIKKVDVALYTAKRKGKNRVETYMPENVRLFPLFEGKKAVTK